MDSETPAAPPPPGVQSNFVNPPSNAYVSLIVIVLCTSVSTLFIVVRMFTRWLIEHRLWWDDWTAFLGWIGIFSHTALIVLMNVHGGSKDIWNVSQANAASFTRYYNLLEIIARIDFFLTKWSILLLFLRCFFPPRTQKTWVYWAIQAVILFNLLYCVALTLSVVLQCVGQHVPNGSTCFNQDDVLVIASTINVVSDAAVLVIPLIAVWNLRMSRERKLKLFILFGVGSLAIVISVARLGWQVGNLNNANRTQYLVTVALLAVSEQAIGLVVACMPVLPIFLRRLKARRNEANPRTSIPPPRIRSVEPLSTIGRSFQQWRFRPVHSSQGEMNRTGNSSIRSQDNEGDEHRSMIHHSVTDLVSSSTSYVDDHEKGAGHVIIESSNDNGEHGIPLQEMDTITPPIPASIHHCHAK